LSEFARGRLGLPGVIPETVNPIKFEILDGKYGAKITSQSDTDANIVVDMSEGLQGAAISVEIFNLSQKRIDILKGMAEKNEPIIVRLGYERGEFKEVGKFVLIDQESEFKASETVTGTFDKVLSLSGYEVASWVCQQIRMTYSSDLLKPIDHCKKIIAKANGISPVGDIATVTIPRDDEKEVFFESHYTSLANILKELADQFGYKVQSISNTIIFTPKIFVLEKSNVIIDGDRNAITFNPIFEYSPIKENEEEINLSLKLTQRIEVGYDFEILGNPNLLVWSSISAKNVDFEKGEAELRTKDDLIIAEVQHNYSSKFGYKCRGRLVSDSKKIPNESTSPMTPLPLTIGGLGRSMTNLVDSMLDNNIAIDIGDVKAIDDADFENEYRTSLITGMDFDGQGKNESRYSRFLSIPETEEESAFYRKIENVSILSPYMGYGYGLFFPVSVDPGFEQRAIIVNHRDESDPLIVGYVLTNVMSSDVEAMPKRNAGDILLHTRAHSKILLPTRVDEKTIEDEIGSSVMQFKSLVFEIGQSYLTIDRPTPDSPNKVRITQDYGGNVNHIIMAEDGKIKIIHKATDENSGDVSIILEDGTVTIVATTYSITGNLEVDGDISATGDVSGATGTFGS
jgi:hypothetical protein